MGTTELRIGRRAVHFVSTMFAACALLLAASTTASAVWTPLPEFDMTYQESGPIAVEYAEDGSAEGVWVVDRSTNTFNKFSPDGQTILYSFQPDYTYSSGEVAGIESIAVDSETNILYAVDSYNHRVLGFFVGGSSTNAEYQAPGPVTECPGGGCPTQSSDPGSFSYPGQVAFHNGEVYVLDGENLRVQVFDNQLNYLRTISSPDWRDATEGDSGRDPWALTINPLNGNVLLGMSGELGIEEYTSNGEFVRFIPTEFGWTDDIAIDAPNKMIYVSNNNRILALDYMTGDLLADAVQTPGEDTWVTALALRTDARVLLMGYTAFLPSEDTEFRVAPYSYDPAPTCANATASTQAPTPAAVSLSCSDANAQLTYVLGAQPANGTISDFNSTAGTFNYTPNSGFGGTETFTFRGRSENGSSEWATVTITVAEEVPVIRKTANLERSSGDIFVKLPGTDTWVKLEKDALVPVGTIIDAADGYCVLTFANADGSLYTGTFWGGVFQILQGEGNEPYAVLKLRDDEFPGAPSQVDGDSSTASSLAKATSIRGLVAAASGKSRAAAKKGKKKNKLWGKGKGKFRTTGDGSSASVRGTRWGVTNYANGTVTQVTSGVVVVRDLYRKKNITLRRGQSYFADKNWKKNRATARAKPRFTG